MKDKLQEINNIIDIFNNGTFQDVKLVCVGILPTWNEEDLLILEEKLRTDGWIQDVVSTGFKGRKAWTKPIMVHSLCYENGSLKIIRTRDMNKMIEENLYNLWTE